MSRLEAAARSHALSRLASSARHGGPPHIRDATASDALRAIAGYGWPLYDVADLVSWAYRLDSRLHDTWKIPPRILRARVALFLRLLRRVEAWERGEMWAEWEEDGDWVLRPHPRFPGGMWHERYLARPWAPLWTDPACPAHDPATTPAQRRASRRGA